MTFVVCPSQFDVCCVSNVIQFTDLIPNEIYDVGGGAADDRFNGESGCAVVGSNRVCWVDKRFTKLTTATTITTGSPLVLTIFFRI